MIELENATLSASLIYEEGERDLDPENRHIVNAEFYKAIEEIQDIVTIILINRENE